MSPWGWTPERTLGIWRYGAIWLRPFADFAYAMPPLVSDAGTIKRICDALADLASREPAPKKDDGGFHE